MKRRRPFQIARAAALLLLCAVFWAARGAEAASPSRYGQNRPNAPAVQWRSIRSDRFRVAYPEGSEALAQKALQTAESAAEEFERRIGIRLQKASAWFLFASPYEAAASNIPASGAQAGVRAWTPLLQRRKTIVFRGLEAEFRRAVRYETAREIQLQTLYPNGAWEAVGIGPLFHPPDWFLEGSALYLAESAQRREEALLRGASLNNQLEPLQELSDFSELRDPELAAAQGYSAAEYIAQEYGEAALGRLLRELAKEPTRSIDKPLRTVLGIDLDGLNKRWQRAAKKRYWPLLREKEPMDASARPLTLSEPAHAFGPAWSPKGEMLAAAVRNYRRDEALLISAQTGQRVQNVSKSAQSKFDALVLKGRPVAWTPDGDALLYIGRKGAQLRLLVSDVVTGELLRCSPLPFREAHSPAPFPDGARIAVAAVKDGRSDLYMVHLNGTIMRRLTDDPHYDEAPAVSPDGKRVLYISERGGQSKLVRLDLESGGQAVLLNGAGGLRDPSWGRKPGEIYFTADWSGARDIYRIAGGSGDDADPSSEGPQRVGSFLAGAANPVVSPDGADVAFTAQRGRIETLFVLPMNRAERQPAELPMQASAEAETAPRDPPAPAAPLPLGIAVDRLAFDIYTPNDGRPRVAVETLSASWTGDFRLRASASATADAPPSASAQAEWLRSPVKLTFAVDRTQSYHKDGGGRLAAQAETTAQLAAEYPIDRAKRAAAALTAQRAPLRYLRELPPGAGGLDAPVNAGALSAHFVRDTATLSSVGPVAGSRLKMLAQYLRDQRGGSAVTLSADLRKYVLMGGSAVFAVRAAAFRSGGSVPETAYLGGHASLRASSYQQLSGSRAALASVELRTPLIRELAVSWPVSFQLPAVRGALFTEAGAAWSRGEPVRLAERVDGELRLRDLKWQYGFGARMRVLGTQLRWDIARQHDLGRPSDWRSALRIDQDF